MGKQGAAKAAAKIKSSPSKQAKQEDMETDEGSRKLGQNFLNQLKGAKGRMDAGKPQEGDDLKVAVLAKYQSLTKFSEEKKQLLELWSKDKSLQWWRTYEESKGSCYKETSDGMEGYGSRREC